MEKTNLYRVYGRLIDENNKPVSDLKVKIEINTGLFSKTELGESRTDNEGNFEIDYSQTIPSSVDEIHIELEVIVDGEAVMAVSKEKIPPIFDFGNIELDTDNIGVEGMVIDENGDPISGLRVMAEDINFGKMKFNALNIVESKFESFIKENLPLDGSNKFIEDSYKLLFPLEDDFLGTAVTDKNGYYRIIYPPSKYKELIEKNPDIKVTVKDKLGVFALKKTKVYENVSDVIKNIDDILINRAQIEGWFPTLKNDQSSRFTEKNNIEILIDNEEAYKKITDVIEEAESYIYLTQYEFHPDFIPKFSKSEDEFKAGATLARKLLEAQNKGIDVKIVVNESPIVPDSYNELKDYFKQSDVEVRRFHVEGPYAMHAKVLVADGKKAFIIGSPFIQAHWDTPKHLIDEPRRLDKNEGPVHDLSIYLEGDAIEYIKEFFIELWNHLSDLNFDGKDKISKNKIENVPNKIKETEKPLKEDSSISSPQNNLNTSLKIGKEPVQIVRSITPDTISKDEEGVLEAYRRAITNAKDFIYIENQYFTNKYIIGALKKALENNPNLQLIVAINEVPDVPTYRSWQHYGFEILGLDPERLLEHPQIGIFTKWSGKHENGKNKMRHCYIHSKVAIVDDVWATIGTANLDGPSLSHAEEFGSVDSTENFRNMEMNALFFDINEPRSGAIEKFRQMLWNEHLGLYTYNISSPDDGWLNLWKKISIDNIKKLEMGELTLYGGILPYSVKKGTKEQIKDILGQYRRIKGIFNL